MQNSFAMKRIFNWITVAGGLVAALTAIGAAVKLLVENGYSLTIKDVEPFATFLNLIIVVVFCLLSIQVPILIAKPDVELDVSEKAILKRVNLIMRQLNNNILGYAGCLIVVYFCYFLQSILPSLKDNLVLIELTNLFNFLSSVFIYLSFKVLYYKTLDEENRSNHYFMDALIFTVMLVFIYLLFTRTQVLGLDSHETTKLTNNFSLLIGILNGLAMGLLFARFISMEYVLTNAWDLDVNGNPNINAKKYIRGLMVFLLPLYATVQPIFGNFQIAEMGNPAIHKNIVFLICLLGKIFFLSVYYYYAHKRWIHAFMISSVNRLGIPRQYITKYNLPLTRLD